MKRLELPRYGWLPDIKFVQVQTISTCNCSCVFPLAGETLVITQASDVPISSLAGKEVLLLAPANNSSGLAAGMGTWRQGTVRSFGIQPLLTLTVKRYLQRKEVRATAEHRWVVRGFDRDGENGAARRRRRSEERRV